MKNQNSFNSSCVLFNSYVSKISSKKYKEFLEDVFRQIMIDNNTTPSFWYSKASLIFSLELLEKNKIVDIDIGVVFQDYNQLLYHQSLNQFDYYSFDDLPFYAVLVLIRLKYSDPDYSTYKPLLIQVAETLIQQIDIGKVNLLNLSIQRHIFVLIKLYDLGIYKMTIECVLRSFEKLLLKTIKENVMVSITFINNSTIYPLICSCLNLKSRIDLKVLISCFLENSQISPKSVKWYDRFYFLNILIRLNNKLVYNAWNKEIESLLAIEEQRICIEKTNESVMEKNILALTLNSYKNTNEQSWDEVLLVPPY
jgi:hypothetical protein